MSKRSPRRGFVVGGSVIGSVIGDDNKNTSITVHSRGDTGAASVKDLQEAVALLLTQIEATSGSDAVDGRLQYELRTIKEELGEDEPDGTVVATRWKQVQKLLGPLQHVASIAQSAERIFTLIGTLFGGS